MTLTNTLPLSPGAWRLDRPHCTVAFTARHMAISKVRGRFTTFDAVVSIGETLESTTVEATVDLASVDTDNPDRDQHLRSGDFFDVERHPTMTFRSTSIDLAADGSYTMTGELTIKGVTRTETFRLVFHGTETFPGDGSLHAGFEATGAIDRKDYGIDFHVPLGTGGFVVSERIGIELDIQLLAPAE